MLPGEANVFPEDVYRSLHQARTIGGGISVTYDVGWRTPIIGQAWMVVRQRIHQEIRIYVDALTTQQSSLNAHFIRALTGVVEGLDAFGLPVLRRQQQTQAETLEKLQAEVERLRAEVETLRVLIEAGADARLNGATASRDA
jgi:hypothetical protein